jgi:hypothetical protein
LEACEEVLGDWEFEYSKAFLTEVGAKLKASTSK